MNKIFHRHFAQVSSTQLELRANLALYQQEAQAILISATTQTQGVGQYGRSWQTKQNAIAFSCTIMPAELPPTPLPLSIIWGIVLLEFLQTHGQTSLQLKWPNDLVINDHKCGGILVENHHACYLCGIGLNWGTILPHEEVAFVPLYNYTPLPAAAIFPGHNLKEEDYRQLPAEIYKFAQAYLAKASQLSEDRLPSFLAQVPWWRHGQLVQAVCSPKQIISGVFEGVTPDGAAIIAGQKVYSGSLRKMEDAL